MASLAVLAMSSTKDELLKHLNLPPETYALMAKETDRVYMWLTSEQSHLKSNCKRKPPYDWSDIQERSKDEAMRAISNGGDQYTNYYWRLAVPTDDCPNWIARWFLYHKFRYRDGRNRTHQKNSDDRKHHHGSKQGKHHRSKDHNLSPEYADEDDYYDGPSMAAASSSSYGPGYPISESSQQYDPGDPAAVSSQSPGGYYDPVRDV